MFVSATRKKFNYLLKTNLLFFVAFIKMYFKPGWVRIQHWRVKFQFLAKFDGKDTRQEILASQPLDLISEKSAEI